MATIFVGRDDTVRRLKSWLDEPQQSNVRVVSIEGSTGVGKTTLINAVLNSINLSSSAFLDLRLRGEDADQDPVTMLWTSAQRSFPQLPANTQPYFGLTRKLKHASDMILVDERRRADRFIRHQQLAEEAQVVLRDIIDAGQIMHQMLPSKVHEYLPQLSKLEEEDKRKLLAFISRLPRTYEIGSSLGARALTIFSPLRKDQDRLVRDLWATLAQDFFTDINCILRDWKAGPGKQLLQRLGKHLPNKVIDRESLLLLIDDYERFQNDFGRYCLVRHLLPRLVHAPFQTTVIISGRDNLSATDPGWDRMFDQELRDHTISLRPLSLDAISDLLSKRGYTDDLGAKAKKVFEETEGYPLLIDTVLSELESGGRSALSVRKFYERLTMGMDATRRRWLEAVSFLPVVNLETIPMVLPKEDSHAIYDWFIAEGSIRDVDATVWTVRGFVKSRIQEWVKLRSQAECDQFTRMARGS